MHKTAESVTPSHPDKLCDRISDAFLDACLEQDPMSRVAIETMGGHGIITVTGELTTKAFVNAHEIVRKIVGDKYGIQTNIVQQSPEIANGVDTGGAGDQGIMNGYACDENKAMIPHEQFLARDLCIELYEKFPFDGKTQVTLDANNKIQTVVASFQNVSKLTLEQNVLDWLRAIDPENSENVIIHVNPAGDWQIGGFEADTGLTGRKLMVDNYGPQVAIGGGCFSGKDATKVDRSAAYMARKIAVNYLNTAKERGDKNIKVWVKLAYAIGVAQPVMATAEVEYDHPKGRFKEQHNLLEKGYDLTPLGIIEYLDLRKPIFKETADFGHFGRGFKWDQ